MELSYPTPRSPSGKVYQFSPNVEAVPRLFLIGDAPKNRQVTEGNQARTRRAPGPGQTICPYSGHMADDDEFVHFEDINAITKQGEHDVAADVSDWLGDWAKDFNRRQPRGGFITMKMDHKPSRRPLPLAIREDLLRDLSCDICERAYAVYAIALFFAPTAARPTWRCISGAKLRWFTSSLPLPPSKTRAANLN